MNFLLLSSNPTAPSTKSLLEAGQKRGIVFTVVAPEQMLFKVGSSCQCFFSTQASIKELKKEQFNWAMARIGWDDRKLSLRALELLDHSGFKMLNRYQGFATSQDKIATALALNKVGIKTPVFSWAHQKLPSQASIDLLNDHPLGVVKWPFGSQGFGVFISDNKETLISHIDSLRSVEAEFFTQELLDDQCREFRFLIFQGRLIASAEKLISGPGLRRNAHQQGQLKKYTATSTEIQLAAQAVAAVGLDFAGVDIIYRNGEAYCIDVNPTPGFSTLEACCELNIADIFFDHLCY